MSKRSSVTFLPFPLLVCGRGEDELLCGRLAPASSDPDERPVEGEGRGRNPG